MTPDSLRARLAALRAAGKELRRRPVRDVVDALAAVLDRWRDPASPERGALERELPATAGFSAPIVREGLSRALAPWSGDALRALVERELGAGGERARGHDVTAVLLAGSIPMPTLLSVIAPLALRSPALVKSAARDPITAPLVARSVDAIDPELARCVGVVDFRGSDAECMRAFLSADCVVATGSDATIAAVAARIGAHQALVRHGHALSVAVLGPDVAGSALDDAARGIALDVALWDQQGCLSPIAVYAVGDTEVGRRAGAALARALAEIGRTLPRGSVEPAAAALAAHERAGAELRAAAGRGVEMLASPDTSWTVVCEPDAAPRPAPLHRFVRVHPVASREQLATALAPLLPHLAGVALAGFGAGQDSVAAELREFGATRVCAPGELQFPPLDWRRDGLPPLSSLLKGIQD